MKHLFIIAGLLAQVILLHAQAISTLENIPVKAKVNVAAIQQDFKPVLQHIEAPMPGGDSYREFLLQQKQLIQPNKNKQKRSSNNFGNEARPVIINGFEANVFDGSVPCDNDVAISNNNYVISVANSTIYMYNIDDDTLLKNISLEAFSDTLNLPANKYDPKVRYDPIADKFIMVFLCGSESAATNIIVAFSETNNPLGNWFLYALDGNPTIQDTVWSDYPIIALSNDELFITVNLLRDRDPNDTRPDAWKFLFEESIIWQINKNDGYTGNTLQSNVFNNIQFNNRPIRNLCPIQGGSTTYGPNMYFLSNRNFDIANDTFFVLEISNTLNNNPQLSIDFRRSATAYGLAPDAFQSNNQRLQTNDSRVLGGYVENNQLHFVMNCINPDSNRAAIYHGIVNDLSTTKDFSGSVLRENILDFGYPNISYSGKFAGDDEAIITFNHVSIDTAAGFSAVFYNGTNNSYSQRITLKQGDSFVNVLSGVNERWGDYSGSQRKYNNPGEVWTAGFFGTRRTYPGSPTPRRINWSYVAALQSPDTSSNNTSILNRKISSSPIKTYPNPTEDIFYTEIELPTTATITITLTDINGKTIKTLYQDLGKKGINTFSFSLQPLPAGIYFLNIAQQGKMLSSKRVVKN